MLKRLQHRTTPATVMAALALFFAVATGGAMAKQLITGADIADGTVTSADVATNTIAGADVDEASLLGVGSALRAPVDGYSTRQSTDTIPADQNVGRATVTCPTGRAALGGGGTLVDSGSADIIGSAPEDENGTPDLQSWSITVRRRAGVTGPISASANAVCARAAGDAP